MAGIGRVGFDWWLRLLLPLLLCVLGCDSSAPPATQSGGTRRFGESCERTEDCGSSLCVRLTQGSGICSTACGTSADCPHADNWDCLMATNIRASVCACRRTADEELCGDGQDNDCDGAIDDCRVCDGVMVSNGDRDHCGACDRACRADQECSHGTCACSNGQTECGGRCVDLQSDSSACGACGNACGVGQECLAGACQCLNAVSETFCPAAGCVDLQHDQNNCGKCGSSCELAQECQNGKCECPLSAAPDFCSGLGCVDLQDDIANCGECGTSCVTGESCVNGKCACPAGQELCDGACIDVQADANNCGGCGTTCGPVQACISGKCGCNVAGYSVCGDECVKLSTDVAHCGSCDTACAEGERCSGQCTCDSDLYCGAVCMPQNDPQNCGACGAACPAGQGCSSGECVCGGSGLTACGATCADLDTDEANCGVCGATCRNTETCVGGYCVCSLGQTYCDSAGKCVPLKSDAQNCGSCGSACDPTEVCSGGACACPTPGALYCASAGSCVDTLQNEASCGACDVKCNPTETCTGGKCGCTTPGQTYCASMQICTDTLANTNHCGGCDKKCNPTEVCANGTCKCSGATEQYCAAPKACKDLASDSLNCGACGTKCGPTAHCAGSTCECNQAGFTFCNGTCYDLQNDDKHCGACGTACSGSYSCDAGQCTCPLPTVGAEVQVTADIRTHVSLAAAWDGTHVGVAYVRMFPQAHYNVYFALLNPDGTLFSNKAVTAYPNTTLGVEPFTVGLVWTGTEYGVAWTQDITPAGMGSHDSIMHRRIKPDGSFVAAATMIADSGFSSFFTIGSALAWSSSYGGYGIAYAHGSYNQIGFQRWVPGQSPGPEQLFVMLGDPAQTQMAAAPDGTWGLAGAYGGLDLSIRNADGTSSDPVEHLRAATVPNFDEPALVHDGTTWLTAMGTPSATAGKTDVSINRGAVLNSPAKLLTSTANRSYLGATLSMVSGTVALLSAYTEGPAADKLLALQRYALPTDNSSNVRPIHDPVIISPTKRLARDFAIVTTGKSSLLAVWIDGRDSTPELYAAPVDLHACP